MNVKLSDLTLLGWLLAAATAAIMAIAIFFAVQFIGGAPGGLAGVFFGIAFFVIVGAILEVLGLNVVKQTKAAVADEPKRGKWLKCDTCSALQPIGTTPTECDWCHHPWSGHEVAL